MPKSVLLKIEQQAVKSWVHCLVEPMVVERQQLELVVKQETPLLAG